MKKYMEPVIEVVGFSVEDVVTASGNFDNETPEL